MARAFDSGNREPISGGPGVAPAPAAAAPKMVEVEINGAKYLVPAEAAEAVQAHTTSLAQDLERTRAELVKAKQPPVESAKPKAPPAATPDDDIDSALFLAPGKTLAKFGETLSEQVKRELREEYSREQAQRLWWDSFYTEHKHLKGADTIVQAVMHSNFEALAALPEDQQQKALADKVDAELAKIVKARAAAQPPKPTAPPIESGETALGGPGVAPPAEPEDTSDRVVTIAEMQRNMRKRRLEARQGRVSA